MTLVDQHGAEIGADRSDPERHEQACTIRGVYPHANGCTIELEADDTLVGEFTLPDRPEWAAVGQLVVLLLVPVEEV